jgi:hypothetical protein
MTHTSKLITLFLLPLVVGCLPQSNVYDRTLYHTQEYDQNMYEDTFFERIQPSITSQITTTLPTYSTTQPIANDPNGDTFAMQHRLSNTFREFKYGFESKLFDGILYCTDAQRISKSRLQLLPTGTGFYLPRAIGQADTLVLFMKAGADTNAGAQKINDLIVHLTFYIPRDNGFHAQTYDVSIQDLVPSNFPGYYSFDLPVDIQQATAFSFQYTIVSPIPSIELASKTGVFLYEVLFPNARWA